MGEEGVPSDNELRFSWDTDFPQASEPRYEGHTLHIWVVLKDDAQTSGVTWDLIRMQVLRAHLRPPNRTSGSRAGQSVLKSSRSSGTHSSLRSTTLGKLLVSARNVSYAIGEVFFVLK